MIQIDQYNKILQELKPYNAQLVAVSKTKPIEDIIALQAQGQLAFGENYVQELVSKQAQLPNTIEWHFIGHLQSNKVKQIAPFVHTIHAVDSIKLLLEIEKQAAKFNRNINCLLQIHVAKEETKFGFSLDEIEIAANEISNLNLKHITIKGLMTMASFTQDTSIIKSEFESVHNIFQNLKNKQFNQLENFTTLSMGMSSDYAIALTCGSTLIRVGSLLFGNR